MRDSPTPGSQSSVRSESSDNSALLGAIEARRKKQEERARLIELGELEVEDPREKRLREMKAQKSKKNLGTPNSTSL